VWYLFSVTIGVERKLDAREVHAPVIGKEDAVLKAADEWVSALQALVAARESSNRSDAEQEALDIAGSRLVMAVMQWRLLRDSG
jgi:hypothetical protein